MVRRILEDIKIILSTNKAVSLLVDYSDVLGMSPQARRLSEEGSRGIHVEALAVIGASFTTRNIVTLLVRASQLFKKTVIPLRFFEDEVEARAWLTAVHARGESA